jgi:hypothetical protein
MIDVIYILASIAFFAVMIAYVAGCERLGRAGASEDNPKS